MTATPDVQGDDEVMLPWAHPWQHATGVARASAIAPDPVPQIPAEDRVDLDPQAMVGLAVVLDMLATRTRPLSADALLLQRLVDAADAVSGLCGATPDTPDTRAALLALADSPEARARQALVRAMSGHAADAGPTRSDAAAVGVAVRQFERAAELVVRHAVLHLTSRDAREPAVI